MSELGEMEAFAYQPPCSLIVFKFYGENMEKIKLTVISISEQDMRRLFGCAVKLKELSGDEKIMDQVEIVNVATSVLEHWISKHDRKFSSKVIN